MYYRMLTFFAHTNRCELNYTFPSNLRYVPYKIPHLYFSLLCCTYIFGGRIRADAPVVVHHFRR